MTMPRFLWIPPGTTSRRTRTSDVFLGIDQSFFGFGFAAYAPRDNWSRAVTARFPPSKFGSGAERLERVQNWLSQELNAIRNETPYTVAGIAMEGYARGARHRREEAGELSAAVRLRLAARRQPIGLRRQLLIVTPTQLKKYATGKGNATKQQVMNAVHDTWWEGAVDDNQADAYVLARIAAHYDLGVPGTDAENDVINALRKTTRPPAVAALKDIIGLPSIVEGA